MARKSGAVTESQFQADTRLLLAINASMTANCSIGLQVLFQGGPTAIGLATHRVRGSSRLSNPGCREARQALGRIGGGFRSRGSDTGFWDPARLLYRIANPLPNTPRSSGVTKVLTFVPSKVALLIAP